MAAVREQSAFCAFRRRASQEAAAFRRCGQQQPIARNEDLPTYRGCIEPLGFASLPVFVCFLKR